MSTPAPTAGGITFVAFVILASILGFIYYAWRAEGVQTWAYLWGLANGLVLCYLVLNIPGEWGAYFTVLLASATALPIPTPELWVTWGPYLGPIMGIGAIYLFVTKVVGWSPRQALAGGAASRPAARSTAGRDPRTRTTPRRRPTARPAGAEA